MGESKAAGKAADFVLQPLTADDVWDFVQIIQKIGVKDLLEQIPPEELQKAQFKAPVMMKDGKMVPMPRDKWNDRQLKRETEAQIASAGLSTALTGCIIEHITDCKDTVNRLLARATGKDAEEIRKTGATEYVRLILQFIDREEFSDFFGEVLQLARIPTRLRISFSEDTSGSTT